MSERFMSQAQYERIDREEHAMVTRNSGISGFTGGNCTKEEHEAYQREFAGRTGWDGTISASATGSRVTPGDTLAAEIRAHVKRLDWVLAHAGGKLDAPELHEFCRASRELEELADALEEKA